MNNGIVMYGIYPKRGVGGDEIYPFQLPGLLRMDSDIFSNSEYERVVAVFSTVETPCMASLPMAVSRVSITGPHHHHHHRRYHGGIIGCGWDEIYPFPNCRDYCGCIQISFRILNMNGWLTTGPTITTTTGDTMMGSLAVVGMKFILSNCRDYCGWIQIFFRILNMNGWLPCFPP